MDRFVLGKNDYFKSLQLENKIIFCKIKTVYDLSRSSGEQTKIKKTTKGHVKFALKVI